MAGFRQHALSDYDCVGVSRDHQPEEIMSAITQEVRTDIEVALLSVLMEHQRRGTPIPVAEFYGVAAGISSRLHVVALDHDNLPRENILKPPNTSDLS
jgi:hypothetical protein